MKAYQYPFCRFMRTNQSLFAISTFSSASRLAAAFLTASLVAASALIAAIATDKDRVVLEFPPNRSFGMIRLSSYRLDKASGRLVETKDMFNLKGTVALPIGMEGDFKLSYDGAESITKLADIIGKHDIIKSFNANDQLLDDKKIAQVARISSIRRLNLAHTDTGDEGVKALTALKKLTNLNVSSTMITAQSVKYLSTMSELRILDLDKNSMDDSIGKELSKLTHMDDLGLKATKISDACVDEVVKLKMLTKLRLGNNSGITDRGIAKLVVLKHLRELEVTDTKVTPKGLEVLKSLPLKIIRIRKSDWSKAQLDRLKAVFPKAELKDGARSDIDKDLFEPLHSPFEKGPQF